MKGGIRPDRYIGKYVGVPEKYPVSGKEKLVPWQEPPPGYRNVSWHRLPVKDRE